MLITRIVVTLVVCVWAQAGPAVPLSPGQGAALSGATPPPGAVLSQISAPYAVNFATGTLTSTVVQEDGTGLLRFEYQIEGAGPDPTPIDFLTAFDFSGFTTDIDFILGSGDGPDSANRNINTVTVSFFSPRDAVMYVRTDATAFDSNGIVRLEQGGSIADFPSFQPVPLPPGVWLLGSAGLLVVLARRARAARGSPATS